LQAGDGGRNSDWTESLSDAAKFGEPYSAWFACDEKVTARVVPVTVRKVPRKVREVPNNRRITAEQLEKAVRAAVRAPCAPGYGPCDPIDTHCLEQARLEVVAAMTALGFEVSP
jgi:hypothetical protein